MVVNGRLIAGAVRTYSGALYRFRTIDNGTVRIRQVEASTSLLHEMLPREPSGRTDPPASDLADRVQPITVPRRTPRVEPRTVRESTCSPSTRRRRGSFTVGMTRSGRKSILQSLRRTEPMRIAE